MVDKLADTQVDTLGNVKGKALNTLVAKSPKEEKVETLCETMGDVKSKPLVDTLPNNLRQANAKINLAHFAISAPRHWSTRSLKVFKEQRPRHLSTQ